MDLIEMPIEQARCMKYTVGRLKYGGEQFVGDPLAELHDELIDAMNYCSEAISRGYQMGAMMAQLETICERVKAIWVTAHEG